MIPEREALQTISKNRGDSIVVRSYLGKEWPESESHLPEVSFVGCMGKAAPYGLGLALARPDKQVIVLEGDGSLLMNLGTLVTIANMAPKNFVCILFENGIYQTTGGHPIPSEGNINFVGLAESAGFTEVYEFTEANELEDHIQEILAIPGPIFINLIVSKDGRRRPITLLKHDYAQFKQAMDALE